MSKRHLAPRKNKKIKIATRLRVLPSGSSRSDLQSRRGIHDNAFIVSRIKLFLEIILSPHKRCLNEWSNFLDKTAKRRKKMVQVELSRLNWNNWKDRKRISTGKMLRAWFYALLCRRNDAQAIEAAVCMHSWRRRRKRLTYNRNNRSHKFPRCYYIASEIVRNRWEDGSKAYSEQQTPKRGKTNSTIHDTKETERKKRARRVWVSQKLFKAHSPNFNSQVSRIRCSLPSHESNRTTFDWEENKKTAK